MKCSAYGSIKMTVMKVFRQLGWCRYLCILSIVWFILIFITINFLRHEPDINASDRINQAIKKLHLLQKRESEMLNLLIEFSYGLQEADKEKFLKKLKHISKNHGTQSEPNANYEVLRRRLFHNTHELWYFINSQITQIKKELRKSLTAEKKLSNFMQMVGEYKRSIIRDVDDLAEVDGYKEWRLAENDELSNLVQRRLHYLQNPKDCKTAKKLLCDLNKGCGYGCQLHHVIYCFIVAYGTERTLILKSKGWRYSRPGWEQVFLPLSDTCTTSEGNAAPWPASSNTQVVSLPIIDSLNPRPQWLPLSIPEDLAPRIIRIHGDPIVWWIGQFLKYLLRLQSKTKSMLTEYEEKLGFKRPIVGIHIRRTDKVGTEAAFHKLDEYMGHVEEYYKTLEMTERVTQKRVYIATDEPKIFSEAKIKYPDYEIIGDPSISNSAAVNNRYSENSLSGIVTDIHMLSLTDYLVCTFSSQVCRVAYEIMNNLHYDASNRYRSLDDIYYYGGQKARYQMAVHAHVPSRVEEIELLVGDLISVAGNHWDGYSKGTNTRTYKTGLYPTFKVVPKIETAAFPTYPQVALEPEEL